MFEYYIETDYLHLKYAKGAPAVQGQEFHNYNEFVLFLSGNAFFISKNIQQNLTNGSLVIIPKEHFHDFRVEHPENYERLILGFRNIPEIDRLICDVMNNIKIVPFPDKKTISLFKNLIHIVTSDVSDEDKKLFIHSSLIQLLIYLKQNTTGQISKSVNLSPEVSRALGIIDEKYHENLSVKSIADMLFLSPSTLAHKFSKELNISIYKYITKKRLMEVHKLIRENNETLSSAAIKCGFCDYSCFYRLYKKYPSE